MKVDIIGTAAEVTPERVQGCDVAVIDVFRATSVMVTALENGAREIIPVTGVQDAFRAKEQLQAVDKQRRILLGGERKTEQIEGFDLDNSPLRYTRDIVEGATIVMSTTNGTRALNNAAGDGTGGRVGDIYVAAFLNADAVARQLGAGGRDVALVCSGRQDRFTAEDGLCAGMMAQHLNGLLGYGLSDFAWWCADLYGRWQDDLLGALAHCEHYRRIRQRWADDIAWCLRRSVSRAVPRLDKETGAVRL